VDTNTNISYRNRTTWNTAKFKQVLFASKFSGSVTPQLSTCPTQYK